MPSRASFLALVAGLGLCASCGSEPAPAHAAAGAATGGALVGGGAAGASAGVSGSVGGVAGASSGESGGGSGGAAGHPAISVSGTPIVYVGGFGDIPVRAYALDPKSGALSERGQGFQAGVAPTYLAVAPNGQHLYAANEGNGEGSGVSALAINPDGTLAPLNHQAGSDATPDDVCNGSCGFTHLAVAPSGKFLVAAGYESGSVSLFPIEADGSLGAEQQLVDFGAGAKAHCVAFDASSQHLFIPTLGLDQVQQLVLSPAGMLSPNSPAFVASESDAGPRHVALDAGGKLAFVMNETGSSITPYRVSAQGTLTAGSSVSSLPAGFQGESYGQHVAVAPNGGFVYGSNVGHNSIAIFAVEPSSGALSLVETQPSGGAWPRDFDIDASGELMVVANRDDSELVVFRIGADGRLTPLGAAKQVPNQPSTVLVHYVAQ